MFVFIGNVSTTNQAQLQSILAANGGNANLLANLNAANFTNYYASNIQPPQASNNVAAAATHVLNGTQQQAAAQLALQAATLSATSNNRSTGSSSHSSPRSASSVTSSPSAQPNANDEQQLLDYMHQLLDEKEKLKELFGEPYSTFLPISTKLLDDGKYSDITSMDTDNSIKAQLVY